MTEKSKKIDYIDRVLALLDPDSIETLYEEAWEIFELDEATLDPQSSKGEFYSTMMQKMGELGEIRNEFTLLKQLLEE